MNANQKADFCIKIDYEKNSENPARIFKCMSMFLENMEVIDHILIQSVDSNVKPILLLEDVETGSLKTWLISALKETDDDALKNLDWKQQAGKYLVRAKYFLINYLEGKTEITDRRQIIEIQEGLLELAVQTEVRRLPMYTPVSPQGIIKAIGLINEPLEQLGPNDRATYISETEETSFNLEFNFVPENLEELFVKETIESSSTMILKVKKPDYLGYSMWEFKHEKRTVFAKILDADWLSEFQSRKVDIRPGDSLKVNVKTSVKYGFDYEVVNTVYEITKVIEVLNSTDSGQSTFLLDEERPKKRR